MSDSINSTTNSSLSILVVDDDELNQRMMRLLLKRDGHLVECASNGAEAFNAVKSKDYDIVLMDLQMPIMDGYETTQNIRELEKVSYNKAYIIALTAHNTEAFKLKCYDSGMDSFCNIFIINFI